MFIPLSDDNPTELRPAVTITIIATCVAVYAFQFSLGERKGTAFVYAFGMIPAVLFGEASLPPDAPSILAEATLVTSMFLHGGIMHLLGNMLYLWVFGNNIEDAMGHGRFVVFYALCGIAAALAQTLIDPGSTIPMIGASGAISGVLGAYLLLHPHAQVNVLLFLGIFSRVVTLPAWMMLLIWIGFQVVNAAYADPGEGGVAWYAHIGGFVAGMALVYVFRRPGFGQGAPRGPWG